MTSYSVDWYHQVPLHVKEILGTLQKAGFEALIVGGAVRDLWSGRTPHDFDLVSNASVEDIAKLFPKTLDIGKAFGIMVVVTDKGPVEVARFRTDGAYTDNRHPSSVAFANPEEDAKRRDFTINALFYDPVKGEVRDYVDGVKDLETRRIRTVGNAETRFKEDALRMLRAIRFHAQLEFSLDPNILHAITKLSGNLNSVSRERITQEIEKIFFSPHPFLALQDLYLTGLWEEVFLTEMPELKDLERLALLETSSAPNDFRREIYLSILAEICPSLDMEKIFLFPKEIFIRARAIPALKKEILKFPTNDLAGKKTLFINPLFEAAWALLTIRNQGITWLEELPLLKKELQESGKLDPPPLINGKDLIAAGIPPGPRMKKILEEVRNAQLNEMVLTSIDALRLAQECHSKKELI